MSQTVVVPTDKVEGNVTSCRIESQVKSANRDSIWSPQEQVTYLTYDVCNKNVIAEYTKPEVAWGGVFLITFIVVVVVMVAVWAFSVYESIRRGW